MLKAWKMAFPFQGKVQDIKESNYPSINDLYSDEYKKDNKVD